MAIRFIEGFELNAATSTSDTDYFERKFDSEANIPAHSAGYKLGFALDGNSYQFTTEAFTDQDVWILHWAWYFTAVDSSAGQAARIDILRGGSTQLSVQVRALDSDEDRFFVDLKRGATTITSAGPFWSQTWHVFELKVTIDPSTGTYELKVNGTSEISDTGVDTAAQGVADADQFRFSVDNGNENMRLDHVIIADDTGTDVDDFFGMSLVIDALPNADGDDLDWTPSSGSDHYAMVNETMPSNDVAGRDAERVVSENVSDVDRWHMQHLADDGLPTGATILAVAVETAAFMEASGSRTIRPVFKDTGGTTAEGDNVVLSDTAPTLSIQLWHNNPATSSAWTVTSVDDGQFGAKVQA